MALVLLCHTLAFPCAFLGVGWPVSPWRGLVQAQALSSLAWGSRWTLASQAAASAIVELQPCTTAQRLPSYCWQWLVLSWYRLGPWRRPLGRGYGPLDIERLCE